MVEVGGFEGGDTTFLTLENITAVAFDDAYDNRDPAPALLFSSGGAGIHVFDSLFHLGDGVTGQRVIDGTGESLEMNSATFQVQVCGSVVRMLIPPAARFIRMHSIVRQHPSRGCALVDGSGEPSAAGFVTQPRSSFFLFDASAYSPSPGPSTTSQLGAFADATAASDWTVGLGLGCRKSLRGYLYWLWCQQYPLYTLR